MDQLWTWGGRCFGYRDGDNLWTYEGYHVGKFYEDEIYGTDGQYLGEIKNGRLIANRNRKSHRKSGFMPYSKRIGHIKHVDYIGYVMLAGHEDFPKLDNL